VQVEQVCRAVQADRGLAGPGCALHADRAFQVGPHQLVLVRLDGGDDVAHRSDPRALDLVDQDPAGGAEFLAPVQVLVLEAGQHPARVPEPPPHRDPLRVGGAGPVEGAGDRRPPVDHHRLAGSVGDVPPPDVVDLPGPEPELTEEQRDVGVIGQLGHPPGQRLAQRLGADPVPGHPLAGGEQRLRPLPHPAQRRPSRRQMLPLPCQLPVDHGRRWCA
jgi:hypothetical protein